MRFLAFVWWRLRMWFIRWQMWRQRKVVKMPVRPGVTIRKNQMVCVDDDGYAVPADPEWRS